MERIYIQKLPANEAAIAWTRLVEELAEPSTEKWIQTRYEVLVRAYVLGDRLIIHSFRRLVNNVFANLLGFGYTMILARYQMIAYAFDNIPSERPILQGLVDTHCSERSNHVVRNRTCRDEDEALKVLSKDFLIRATCRFGECHRAFAHKIPKARCYYEHESEAQKKACTKSHMVYDQALGTGFFPE